MDEQLRILIAARNLRRFTVAALVARADVPVARVKRTLSLFEDLIRPIPNSRPSRYQVVRPRQLQVILDRWEAKQLPPHPPRRSAPAEPWLAHLAAADAALAAAARTIGVEDRLLLASACADSAQALLEDETLPVEVRRDASVLRRTAAVLIADDTPRTSTRRLHRRRPVRQRDHS